MIAYSLIRSRRRTVALEITKDGRVLVRAPLRYPQAQADALVTGHSGWIARHLELQRRRQAAAPPPTAEEIAALRARAQEALPPRVAYYGARMGLRPNGVRITAARTRFGSCSGKDVLCFSCFLMRYPPEAVDLVVVHELCHIRVKNHGPAFYALLGSVLPDYRERKKLLSAPLPPKPAEP